MIVALVTGIIVQWLTLGILPGLGDSLGYLLLLIAFGLAAVIFKTRPTRVNLWILVPLLFFIAMLSLRDSELLYGLNAVASLGLICVLALRLRRGPIHQMTLVDQIRGVFVVGLN